MSLKLRSIITLSLFLKFSCALALEVQVIIEGVDEKIKSNIEASLSLIQTTKNRELSKEQIQLLHRRSDEEILLAVQPFGYYHAQVNSTLKEEPNLIKAVYVIHLGTPTLIDELSFKLEGSGVPNPNLEPIFDEFPLNHGDIFEHEPYETGKAKIQQKAFNEGYVKAYYTRHEVLVDLSRFQADIHLTLNTGLQFTFGDVSFKDGYYAPHFLNRFVEFEDNEPYRLASVATLESRLMQSGLFTGVTSTPIVPEEGTSVPLEVELKEAPANRYLLGVGYDTNTRSRLRLGWERKKITSTGHQFKSQFKLSEKDTLLDAYYIIPGKRPWVDQYMLAFGYADDEYKDKPSRLFTVEVSETREIWSLKRTIGLRYLKEDFKDSHSLEDSSNFLLPSLRLSKTKLDNVANPRNGYRAEFFVRGGIDALLSDANFIQFYLQYKWLKSLGENGTFIARTELGATLPDEIEKLPLSIRFYAGGIDSLRGFRYRSLPFEVDDDGQLQPVGGAYLGIASLEYNHTLYGPLKGAIFVDGGSALRKLDDDLQLAAGFGLRWQTPIGPLKLDLAKPLSNAAEVWRLHFSFGPEL